ncbi:SH3 domain-containing protein [Rhizobium sp. PAMB 3174]
MRGVLTKIVFSLLASFLHLSATAHGTYAQAAKGASGLPLPRFASLKASRVNMRVGPSTDYAVEWLYTRHGLPVEIIQEYDNWRRIRDADGVEGWVNRSLLSGDRTAITAPWMRGKGADIYITMRNEPEKTARVIAKMEPGVVLTVKECNGDWCEVTAKDLEGWVAQAEIWGAYPGEAFK